MKRTVITLMLIIFSISFCGAQSLQEAARLERERQEQQQRAAEAERQRAAAQRQQQEAARQAEARERERIRGMQLTLDNIFYLVNIEDRASVGTFLSSREWELKGRDAGKDEGFPEGEVSDWSPKSSLNNLPVIRVLHFGSFDNAVLYGPHDEDHLRRLENDVKARGYQEIPRERALFTDVERNYRNDLYEVGVSNKENLICVLNYTDIEFYRAEIARLEKEAFERANAPATLYIYRPRNTGNLSGMLGALPRYDVLLDNVVVGRTGTNTKTSVSVTPPFGYKTVSATIDGRSAEVQINFEPGGVYYIRCDVSSQTRDTGRTQTTTNKDGTTSTKAVTETIYTPTFRLMDKSAGEREFNATNR